MHLPAEVATRAATRYRRGVRGWVTGTTEFTPFRIPLGNPTGKDVVHRLDEVKAWLAAWRAYSGPGEIDTVQKRLDVYSRVEIPTHLTLRTAEEVAQAAGRAQAAELRRLRELWSLLRDALGNEPELAAAYPGWRAWDRATAVRAIRVIGWLRTHDASEFYLRELPVPGVDTKWIEQRLGVLKAITGDITFRRITPDYTVRTLDPALRINSFDRVSVPVTAQFDHAPFHTVLVVENLATFHALPALPGTLAIFGAGFREHVLAEASWLSSKRLLYWGDLDSHGFAILHRFRSLYPHTVSVLMDAGTFHSYRDLAVREPTVHRGDLPLLTPAEQETMAALREAGGMRLEQERIPFDHVERVLRAIPGAEIT